MVEAYPAGVRTSRVRCMNLAGLIQYTRSHRGAVVASLKADGGPAAAYLEIAVTDAGELVFDTMPSSRITSNVQRDHRVAIVYGGPEGTTLQCEGLAERVDGAERARYEAAYLAAFPDYTLEEPTSVLVRVRLRWAQFGDFTEDGYETHEVDLT